MINGNIKFFFDNLINDDSDFAFTSAEVSLANKLYNNKRDDRLQSSGSDDVTSEVWTIDFKEQKQFNRIYVDNHNIRLGYIRYSDGVTFVDFEPLIRFSDITEVIIPDELTIENLTNPFGISIVRSLSSNDDRLIAASDDQKIAYSLDSGATWSALIANPFTAGLDAIAFVDESSSGSSTTVVAGGGTELGQSTDSGATWSLVASPLTGTVCCVHANQDTGTVIAAGGSGNITRSTDGGATYSALIANSFLGGFIRGLASNGSIVVGVAGAGRLSRSLDDGVTWGALIPVPTANNFVGIANNGSIFVAVTDNGIVIRSTDDGATWKQAETNFGFPGLNGVRSFGSTFVAFGTFGGDSFLSFSDDDGITWSERLPTNVLAGIDLEDANFQRNTLILCGNSGKIFNTVLDFDLTNYFEFDPVISDKIRINMDKTQQIDNEKAIGDALCFQEIGTVQTNPSEIDFEFSDFANTSNTGTGGNVHASFGEKWNAEITFSDACKKDVALFRKIKNLNKSFFVLPGGGIDREQEGFRLRDIFRVNFVNSFEPQVKGNLFGIGTILAMELGEV